MQTVGKILCIGRNYVEHIKELGNEIPSDMVVFFKPASAIDTKLNSSHLNDVLHYEAELCFQIKDSKLAKVGLGLDLTKRAVQSQLKSKGLPWEKAKAFDGSAVFTQFVEFDDWANLSFTLHIDEQLTQHGKPELMMYSPDDILQELSRHFSLQDGDIIMTGTPKGVGEVKKGQTFGLTLLNGDEPLISQSFVAV